MVVSLSEVYLEGLVDLAAANGLKTIALINKDTLFPKASVVVSGVEVSVVADRFMRTLKEQCVYLRYFESLEARAIIAAFIARYNAQWLIERLGHRTPAQARAETTRRAASAPRSGRVHRRPHAPTSCAHRRPITRSHLPAAYRTREAPGRSSR